MLAEELRVKDKEIFTHNNSYSWRFGFFFFPHQFPMSQFPQGNTKASVHNVGCIMLQDPKLWEPTYFIMGSGPARLLPGKRYHLYSKILNESALFFRARYFLYIPNLSAAQTSRKTFQEQRHTMTFAARCAQLWEVRTQYFPTCNYTKLSKSK